MVLSIKNVNIVVLNIEVVVLELDLVYRMDNLVPSGDLEDSAVRLVVLVHGRRVPGQPLLVELDHNLRTLAVCLPGGDQVGLVAPLPLDQEHQLPGGVSGTDNTLGLEPPFESSRPSVLGGVRFLGRGPVIGSFSPLPFDVLLGLELVLEPLDEVGTVQVLLRLPSVLLGTETLPREVVLDLAVARSFVQDFVHNELVSCFSHFE